MPVFGCKRPFCPFCYNEDFTQKRNQRFSSVVKDALDGEYSAVIFGGGEPLLKIDEIIPVMKELKDYEIKIGVQTRHIREGSARKLLGAGVDYIAYTVNDIKDKTYQRVSEIIPDNILDTKVIYIPGKTEYPSNLKGQVTVQQFINQNCLSEDYKTIKRPSREEVLSFAKSIKADFIITEELGRERI